MQQVQLADDLYEQARRRAAEAGFSSVDQFIADMLSNGVDDDDADDDQPNQDHLFTPERVAELERISARTKSGGRTYTIEETRQHFDNKRQQWLKDHRS